jgi:hypothetical protein
VEIHEREVKNKHYERIRARHNVRGLGEHIGLRCWQIDLDDYENQLNDI